MKRTICLFGLLIFLSFNLFSQIPKRSLRPGDIYRLQTLSDANVSPDGKWVAYTVSTIDSAKDKRNTDIWMVSMDGKETVQLTNSREEKTGPAGALMENIFLLLRLAREKLRRFGCLTDAEERVLS
ncbi:MAG: hypothetical protein WKG06_29550 [Segetibacter sp.]